MRSRKSLSGDRIGHLVSSEAANQTLTIPQRSSDVSKDHPSTITSLSYAEFGAPCGKPVLLILGLGGHRYFASLHQTLAIRHNIRLICIDRPGKGQTTPLSLREAHLDAVSAAIASLLKHLSIPKIAIFSHSLGDVYTLEFIKEHPDLLDTNVPVHLLAPWCVPSWPGVRSRYYVRLLHRAPSCVIKAAAWTIGAFVQSPRWLQKAFMSYKGCEKGFTSSDEFFECSRQIAKAYKREGGIMGVEEDLTDGAERWGRIGLVPEKVTGVQLKIWWGDRDKMLREESVKELCRVTGGEFAKVPDGRHGLIFNPGVLESVFLSYGSDLRENHVTLKDAVK
eukprot:Plantae.Rhodophyta-Hildenbrandia_rubra.ctg29789.p1 GENE.Plantae.Rhodophyta-Hildenbrandia_rubra.ctg29789~~Plantae.Rhodophyta-Hildenbrandia_rubra.ctg29789.p1  ORF type:complete len:336 (-),score=41.58 Plantae.Rhodophyta-Hildenbrandia_rubra.ctg29789:37-1044(-)